MKAANLIYPYKDGDEHSGYLIVIVDDFQSALLMFHYL
jgi:hypothetical protein